MQQTALPQDRDFLPFALGEADARIEAGGLVLERMDLSQHASQFDLSLMMGDVEGDLPVSWQYDTDLFDASTIERIAAHYEALLGAIVADPDRTIGAFSFLSQAEEKLLLDRWSHGEKTAVSDRCVTRAFEEQVRSTPEATALQQGDVTWTYADLNRRANRLARHLNALGVGAEDRVGVCFDRSPELIQAILSVLKAGGAYVPLDPDMPAERLGLMAADAAISVLLCDAAHVGYVPDRGFAAVVISAEEEALRDYDDGDLESAPAIDALSQVLYTSGSTGVPKGVLLEHRGIVNRLAWLQSYHPLRPSDRVLQKAAYGFDVSVWRSSGRS
jgi:non-ribosomal peptide synthetase component F